MGINMLAVKLEPNFNNWEAARPTATNGGFLSPFSCNKHISPNIPWAIKFNWQIKESQLAINSTNFFLVAIYFE